MKRAIVLLVSGIVAIGLAGCVADPTTSPTTSIAEPATETPTAAPTPTGSPTPTTRPALGDMVVTTEGFGPFLIGAPVVEQPTSTAVATWSPTQCSPDAGADFSGAWLAAYPTANWLGRSDWSTLPFTFSSPKKTSPLTFVVIWSDQLRTAKGVGVGSTVAQLTAAYPSLAAVPGATTQLYVLPGTNGDLVFDVATDVGDTSIWTPADVGHVVWMYLQPHGMEPSSIANSDVGGYCSV